MPNYEFAMGHYYMFIFVHGPLGECAIVETPTKITEEELLFHFLLGLKSEAEYVKKENILAVGDYENGTVEILGWSGKYTILNQKLFNKYINSGIIKLKEKS